MFSNKNHIIFNDCRSRMITCSSFKFRKEMVGYDLRRLIHNLNMMILNLILIMMMMIFDQNMYQRDGRVWPSQVVQWFGWWWSCSRYRLFEIWWWWWSLVKICIKEMVGYDFRRLTNDLDDVDNAGDCFCWWFLWWWWWWRQWR